MSARSNPVPINKTPSSENVFKLREDRSRYNGNPSKYKQRNDNGSSAKHIASSTNQPRNVRGQLNIFQKQPRSKTVWGGKRTKVTSEQRQEMGGKKVNLNHLLNFTYDHHEETLHTKHYRVSYGKAFKGNFYNKEQFIQANCQLVIRNNGNYEELLKNFDLPVNWDDVEKVNIWKQDIPTCPICLSEFCAAHMTKCGHIYCWPCILHYLALDDKTWRKCPICHEAIHKSDLKSVTVHPEKKFKVQNYMKMRLMKRAKESMIAVPANSVLSPKNKLHIFNENLKASEQRNAKYLIASPKQVMDHIVSVDQAQLEFRLATELDEFEKTFIQSALDICTQRLTSLAKLIVPHQADNIDFTVNKIDAVEDDRSDGENMKMHSHTDGSNIHTETDEELEDKNDFHYFYFYQASNGEHVYLHPLNARCLFQNYGSYARCPAEINVRILANEEFTMNENTRQRHRYLAHLPLSLEFRIVEVELRSPLVSNDTLALFQEAIDRRAAMRRKKCRDEKRALRKAQNEALRKQGKYPEARICLENHQQFPQIEPFNGPASSYSVLFPSPGSTPCCDSAMASTSVASFSPEGGAASSNSESSLSFAQMLKSSGSDESSAWSRRVPLTKQPPIHDDNPHSDDDEENYAAPPDFQTSFSDAISAAFDNLAVQSGKKSKKGKKGKKLVLFSTSGQHH